MKRVRYKVICTETFEDTNGTEINNGDILKVRGKSIYNGENWICNTGSPRGLRSFRKYVK